MKILEMAKCHCLPKERAALFAAFNLLPYERIIFQALLKIKEVCIYLPNGYFFGMRFLNQTVDDIDPTIYGFEEKINEIEGSSKKA